MSLSMSHTAASESAFSMASLQASLFDSHIIEVLALLFALLVVHICQPMVMAMWKVLVPTGSAGPIKGQKTVCDDDQDESSCDDDALSTAADSSDDTTTDTEDDDVISIPRLLSLRPKVGPAPKDVLRAEYAVPQEGLLTNRSVCRQAGNNQPSSTLKQRPLRKEVAPRLSKLGPLPEVDESFAGKTAPMTQLQKEVALGRRMSRVFQEEALVFRETRKAFQEALDEIEANDRIQRVQTPTCISDAFQGLVFCETRRALHDALESLGGPL